MKYMYVIWIFSILTLQITFYFEKLKGIETIIFHRMITRILIPFCTEVLGKSLTNFHVIIKKYLHLYGKKCYFLIDFETIYIFYIHNSVSINNYIKSENKNKIAREIKNKFFITIRRRQEVTADEGCNCRMIAENLKVLSLILF